MAYLTRWEPFPTRTLVDGLFRDMFDSYKQEQTRWSPRVDLKETPEAFVLRVELPGLSPEEIEVEFKDKTLTIQGEKRSEQTVEGDTYHLVERTSGKFVRRFSFSAPVDGEKIEAKSEHGLLTVTLAKAAVAQPKRIEVR